MWEIQDSHISIKIPSANKKLLTSFPNDPRADIKIIFGSKLFYLSKPHLRLESDYFKRTCGLTTAVIQIKSALDVEPTFEELQVFGSVMSCFYGAQIKVERAKIGLYYKIVHFLEIETMLCQLKQDIIANINKYNLFQILGLAQKCQDQQIFQICFEHLEKQSYSSLRLELDELNKFGLPLLKLVLKSQAQYLGRTGQGISCLQIESIIKMYCEVQNIEQKQFEDLKHEFLRQNFKNTSNLHQTNFKRNKESTESSPMQKCQDDFSQQLRLPFDSSNSQKKDSEIEDDYCLKEKIENVKNELSFNNKESAQKMKTQKQSHDIERSFGTKLQLNESDKYSQQVNKYQNQ